MGNVGNTSNAPGCTRLRPTVTMSVYAHWFSTRKTAGTMAAAGGAAFRGAERAMKAVSDKTLRG